MNLGLLMENNLFIPQKIWANIIILVNSGDWGCNHSNGHAVALIYSVHPVIVGLTMHSGALSDSCGWEMSDLGGLCQAGATYWTLDALSFVSAI